MLATRNALATATNQANTGAASINTAVAVIENNQSGDLSSVGAELNQLSTGATAAATARPGPGHVAVQRLRSALHRRCRLRRRHRDGDGDQRPAHRHAGDGDRAGHRPDDRRDDLGCLAAEHDRGADRHVRPGHPARRGAQRVPILTPDQRSNAEQVLSAPADVQTTVDNAAIYYGRGLAPFMFALAIWVFCLVVFSLMRPITLRALAGRASSARIAVAGWLPIVGVGALGSVVLLAVAWFALGLDPVNAGGSVAVVVLAAACFTAVAHLLRTWLGLVGTAIALVLLILQVACCGGIYPVETMPAPLRAINPLVPMTYLVDALRITFTGGPIDHLWQDVAVLGAFTVVAVALCVFVVSRKRRFSMGLLHPALP